MKLEKAKLLLEQAKWSELLTLCRVVGLKSAPFVVYWMTAASALDDEPEIDRIIEAIRAGNSQDVIFKEGKLLTRLAALLESTTISTRRRSSSSWLTRSLAGPPRILPWRGESPGYWPESTRGCPPT